MSKRRLTSIASDAELETIAAMWGRTDVRDIAATIHRKPSTVLKWAKHVLHLLPAVKRHSPLKMRCQACHMPQVLAEECAKCGEPRHPRRVA
jgi:hypothetical protein